jgi:phosphatidylglycerophosphatase A
LSPVAPGTVGSLEAVAIYLAVDAIFQSTSARLMFVAGLAVATYGFGVWAATRASELSETEDPGHVVIDEVCGQLVALTPVAIKASTVAVVLAFVLFRLFDIFKPYPVNRLERLRGGYGVMSDDLMAGAYAAVLVGLAIGLRVV